MIKKADKNEVRKNRHRRMRRNIRGTEERLRLNVYRSQSNIYAQLINDDAGETLVSASTLDAEVREKAASLSKKQAAKLVGETIGRRAVEKGIEQVVFDRGGYLYTGRVAELAAGAREAGLKF
ncbi:MAG: 50S ribosomal protein L18 [Christensenellales bacterium]|jgi:large subunit ribosomal protein L18|nr:50S ribosomal protein L18 [Clostridiales bacterium]